MKKIAIIGSGFSGLSASCFMAKQGLDVTVFEMNATIGGRARVFTDQGFMFDMGPSWYWMPDVFEQFFAAFNKKPSDYYSLVQLNPGFQMIFGKDDILQVPAELNEIYELFEGIEKGSADQLRKFLKEGEYKYQVGMQNMVYKPFTSWFELADFTILSAAFRLNIFKSVSAYVRGHFKDPRLVALMEFPSLFLGAMADQIPALYSMINYAAFSLGTWYPIGGMFEIITGMESLAKSMGVNILTGVEVQKINVQNHKAINITTTTGTFNADGIIASGDYHHVEELLDKHYRNYTEPYWNKRTMAPSCLIFYVGVNKKIKKLIHHNLFFDTDIAIHTKEIYQNPKWPSDPLFYVCCPSKTDHTVAPQGMENLFLLVPIATGLEDTPERRQHYFDLIIRRIEEFCDDKILPYIVLKKSYCINDFVRDYHSYKGNAYGLANTLRQTAMLKPSLKNKKVSNMFYAGQLTVPGPGVPPALISGQIAAGQLLKYLK